MLEIAVIILKAFPRRIDHRIIDILQRISQILGILLQTRTIDPMQGNIRTVGTGPFGRIASVLPYTIQYVVFQFSWKFLFARTHLDEQYSQFLRFGNLVIPPIMAPRITFLPKFQSFHNLIIQSLFTKIFVLRIGIGKHKIADTLHMNQRRPIGTPNTGIVHISERTVFFVILSQCPINGGIGYKILTDHLHQRFKLISRLYIIL